MMKRVRTWVPKPLCAGSSMAPASNTPLPFCMADFCHLFKICAFHRSDNSYCRRLAKATIIVKASKLQLFRSYLHPIQSQGNLSIIKLLGFSGFSRNHFAKMKIKVVFQLSLFAPRSIVYFLYSISIRVEKRKRGGFHFFVKV